MRGERTPKGLERSRRRIDRWLRRLAPRATHEEARRRELILTVFLLGWLVVGVVAGLVFVFDWLVVHGPGRTSVYSVLTLAVIVLWLLGGAGLLRDARRGRLRRASVGVLAVLAGMSLGLTLAWSVQLPAAIVISVLFVALAAVFLEGRSSSIALGGILGALTIVQLSHALGVLRADVSWLAEPDDYLNGFLVIAVLASIAGALLVLNRELRTPIGALVSADPERSPLARSRTKDLTVRETEITKMVAEGKSDKQIAEELFISPRTVGSHVGNALRKTECPNRTALASLATHEGLITPVRGSRAQ